MHKTVKIIGIAAILPVLIVLILFILVQNIPAPEIVVNFIELDKIEKISKFRSCAGHTTVPQDESEMKRSMKHYFWVKPEFLKNNAVAIYSPYDGYVTSVREDKSDGLEGEIWIAPKDVFVILPPVGRWMFSVQHINILPGLKRGNEVKAGQLIGYAAVTTNNRETFDIVFAKGGIFPKKIDNWMGPFIELDSVFNHMSKDVLAKFTAKKLNLENIIISKEARDQNPCVYKDNGPYFLNQDDESNWVILK